MFRSEKRRKAVPHERYSQETKTAAKEVLSGYPEIYEGALLKLSDDREVLKKLIEKDDGDSKNWCYVDALLLNFRCEPHFFKGVAVAEKPQQSDRYLVSTIWLCPLLAVDQRSLKAM